MVRDSATGLPLLTPNEVKGANPICPDGVHLKQHFDQVLSAFSYLTEYQKTQLRMAGGWEPASNSSAGNTNPVSQDLGVSLSEQIQGSITLLKTVRESLEKPDSDTSVTPSEKVRMLNAINNSLNTIRRLMPEIKGSKTILKMQDAMVKYAHTLDAENKEKFMKYLEEALIDKLND